MEIQKPEVDHSEDAKMVSVRVSAVSQGQQPHVEAPAKTYRIPGAVLTIGAEPTAMEVTEKEAEHMKLDKFLRVEVVGPVVTKHDSERHPVITEAASNMPHVQPKPVDPKPLPNQPTQPGQDHPQARPGPSQPLHPAQEPLDDHPPKGGHKR